MATSFKLPDLGEGIHEGEIIKIFVSEGDRVAEGDLLVEVETDKAAVEIPSPYTGTIKEIRVKSGDTVNVGEVLVIFEEAGKWAEKPEENGAEAEKADKVTAGRDVPAARMEEPVPASPATRRLARELSVDLSEVAALGRKGLITEEDVRAFAEKRETKEKEAPEEVRKKPESTVPVSTPPLPDFGKWGRIERIPYRSVRRSTGRQMALAWSQIPHASTQDDIDVTRLEEFRRRHRSRIEEKGGRLSLTVFALKAVAEALRQYPNFNASLDADAEEIIIKHYYHVGVAVNTEEGIIVPVIRDVDRKNITDLSVELNELVARTRERKIGLEELQGGTFTITNTGPLGGKQFSPIINLPQVAILGMGSARMQPVVVENKENGNEIVPRLMMPVVLCFDHRVLDGADAIRFMKVVKTVLENPDEMSMAIM
jgi:pyruvate dehydrogenase E2 component (dihydrolipoamide acetyltransferase)